MLTKTDFLLYLDSPLHLWYKTHGGKFKEPSSFELFLRTQGYEVERLAEKYLKKHVLPQYGKGYVLKFQEKYIDGEYSAISDVVIENTKTGEIDLYEIKSSASIKEKHEWDASFQRVVCKASKKVGKVFILIINNEYRLEGDLDISKLFSLNEITDKAEMVEDVIMEKRKKALVVTKQESAEKLESCDSPKDCPCVEICHGDLGDDSIHAISGIRKKLKQELSDLGIKLIKDIPSDLELPAGIRFVVDLINNRHVHIDKDRLSLEMGRLIFPLYFLDYETINYAVPRHEGYKAFQHVVFQYSLHVLEDKNGEMKHYEYISTDTEEPLKGLLECLNEDIGDTGSIVVWHKSFEKGRNKEMALLCPEHKEFLEKVDERVYDLMDIVSKKYYAHYKFKGSSSIKNVLPVLAPDLSYRDLEISDGSMAMIQYMEMIDDKRSEKEKTAIKNNLLEYCKLDTYAMYMIWKHLMGV